MNKLLIGIGLLMITIGALVTIYFTVLKPGAEDKKGYSPAETKLIE
jgi:hypothetical protein